jgi:antitoxin component YwqK of YwqJK toxin-antitoxin module
MQASIKKLIVPVTTCALPLIAVAGFAALVTTGGSINVAQLSEVTIDVHTGLRMYRGRSFTGEARKYSANGTLARAEQFTDGRRHGFLRLWFADGTIGFDSNYQAGRREGTTISWWDNGNMRSRTQFVDDRPDGVAWSWYRSGEVFKRYNYEAGQPVGIQQGWRKNGKLFSNFEYRNGRAYGLRNSNLCVELDDELLAIDY